MPDRGLLVDFGGVLTTPVTHSFRQFCRERGMTSELVKETFLEAYQGVDGTSPVHLVETGRITGAAFAEGLARSLSARAGVEIPAAGLIEALFATVELDERMLQAVATIRRAGVRTALLSNSWGDSGAVGYPTERFAELFDAVVISGEVGLRKPDPRIFALTTERIGLAPGRCVFVDDLPANVEAAEAMGIAGVVHRGADETLPRLGQLLGLEPGVLDPRAA